VTAAFAGFPARAQATAIPHVFFSDLLPLLADDPVAIGVTLYAFHALRKKRGFLRYLTDNDLVAEPALLSYLMNADRDESAIAEGLHRACAIGVLLALPVERDGTARTLYFLNTPSDRRALDAVRSGAVDVGATVPRERVPAPLARSSVFTLYESLIGTISPLIADELTEAERLYPHQWLERAFREAAAQNVRSWRYVSRILERWSVEGPNHEKTDGDPAGDDRYLSGKYGRLLKQRLQS
jgi:DnaD/phage-associated family protein